MAELTTASINLITGNPGAGKTLRAIWLALRMVKDGETVYVSNVNGCNVPGHIHWEDPRAWEDLPAGSVLIVDEAQRYFPARRAGVVPAYVRAMETIRHKGVRLLLTTQKPEFLDAHMRGLVGMHEHMLCADGKGKSMVYRAPEIMSNVGSKRERVSHDYESWAHPVECFSYYKSAEIHTVVPKMRSLTKRAALILGIGAIIIAGVFYTIMVRPYLESKSEANRTDRATEERAQGGSLHSPASLAYVDQLQPELPHHPWSAPVFQKREAKAEPELYCIASADRCICHTEQGTRYNLQELACRGIVNNGLYNPFREPDKRRGIERRSDERMASAESGPRRSGGNGAAPRIGTNYVRPVDTPTPRSRWNDRL